MLSKCPKYDFFPSTQKLTLQRPMDLIQDTFFSPEVLFLGRLRF